jgi:flagellar FliL protein
MADETTAADEVEKPKSGKKKLIVIAAAAVGLIIGAGAGGAWFFGFLGGADDHAAATDGYAETAGQAAEDAAKRRSEIVFVDIPEILVNLHSLGPRSRFLKLKVALEVENEGVATEVETLMPRVMDSFQTYLRALTIDEVSGSGGLGRLKEELTARVNLALSPAHVGDVLIKEMLVQ